MKQTCLYFLLPLAVELPAVFDQHFRGALLVCGSTVLLAVCCAVVAQAGRRRRGRSRVGS